MPLITSSLCSVTVSSETEHFDVYIREVLVSVTNVIPFTHPSRRGLTPQKTYNDFFKANKTKQKKGAAKHPR